MTMVTGTSPKAGAKMNRQQRRQAARLANKGSRRPAQTGAGKQGFGSDTAGEIQAALGLHQAGNFQTAAGIYRRILDRHPGHCDALHLLGLVAYQTGQNDTAVELIGRALAIDPKFAEAHNSLGAVLQAQGKPDQALTCYQRAIANKSDYVEAHNNLGSMLKDQGKGDEAIAQFGRALAIDPNYAAAHNNLGNLFKEDGKLDEAVARYRSALDINPNLAEAHNGLGIALHDIGELNDAVVCYQRAIAILPGYAEAHNNLGKMLIEQGKLDDAITHLQRAVDNDPGFAVAHSNLGSVFRMQGKLDEAVASCQRALVIDPSFADAHRNFGNILLSRGKLEEAVAAYRRALAVRPDFAEAHYNLLFIMNYDARVTAEEIFAESRNWDAAHAAPRAERFRPLQNTPDPERRLRIGYVSPDLRAHPVSFFVEPLLAGHDRGTVEVFCYAEVPRPDQITERFQALADGWRSTVGLTDAELADRIREDRIDILIDLAGHTGNNRLLALAERPAPVQVSWCGYPNTTGMTAIDYRLTDARADPQGEADALHSETLVRLPDCFLCYAPPPDAPEAAPPPGAGNGHITFGSFNKLTKLRPETIAVWAQILERVPDARLMIKSKPLADEKTRKHYLKLFAAKGIGAERLDLVSWVPSHSGHLGAYSRVDIALDTFPYNGTTTTCEALWMGVPVIALRGDRHAARVGLSLLAAVGVPEFAVPSTQAYVETAVGLANDLDRLTALRNGLRERMRASPLCDAAAFARNVESAYRDMWRTWCHADAGPE